MSTGPYRGRWLPFCWAAAANDVLRKANAEADRFEAMGRHDEAWWVLSVGLSESFKEKPRDFDEVLKESPSPFTWKYQP